MSDGSWHTFFGMPRKFHIWHQLLLFSLLIIFPIEGLGETLLHRGETLLLLIYKRLYI